MKKVIAAMLVLMLMTSLFAACNQEKQPEIYVEEALQITAPQSVMEFTFAPTGQVIQKTPFTIDGYVLSDGVPAPVTVTLQIDGVLTGQEAFESISYQDPSVSPAPQGQEYLLVLLTVTYEDGVLDSISMAKNEASLPDAQLFFALPNGDSRAVDVSDHLNNSLYNQTIWEGDSVGAAIAFLQEEGNSEPLTFTGFGQVAAFAKEVSVDAPPRQQSATKEEAELLKAFAQEFMNAYIFGDVERMKDYLMETPTADPQVYDGVDFLVQVVPISAWETWAQELKSEGECEVSIPFKCDPLDDYYTYLTIAITNKTGTPKVIWYGLEG